ncbi:MAG: hypothetical protein LAT82_00370 [Nanoarchaeota archaeon]|nr:hypothetical protein [Nanoarchaeota archaeon]
MTTPIDLEMRRIEKMCTDVYEPGVEVTIPISSELSSILEIAYKYLHPAQKEFEPYLALSQPFGAFMSARNNGFSLEQILTPEILDDAQGYFNNSDLDLQCRLIFSSNVDFLNEALNTLQKPAPNTCQIIAHWFVDSFVKFYNDRLSPLQFPTKTETRKEAMKCGNSEVVNFSGEKCRILNFPLYLNYYE